MKRPGPNRKGRKLLRSATRELATRQTVALAIPVALLAGSATATAPAVLAIALGSGASLAQAGLITILAAAGSAIASVPAGHLAGRFGTRVSLPASAITVLVGLLLTLAAPNLTWLAVGTLVVGFGGSASAVSRLVAVAETMDRKDQPEAFVRLGAALRVGAVAGPLLGAAAYALTHLNAAPIFAGVFLAGLATVLHLTAKPAARPSPGRALPNPSTCGAP